MEPIFYCRLDLEYNYSTDENDVVIASTELPEGIRFKVAGYSQVDVYTLVMWQQGDDEEYFAGENLWRGYQPIATTGGALDLYSPNQTTEKIYPSFSIWDRVDATLGNYGIPSSAAIALRDVRNIVYL